MGKRGPQKTPTAVLNMRGSLRGRYRNPAEPQPESGVPDCPVELEPLAAEIWQRVTALLDGMGVLTKVDGLALARYCDTFAQWEAARELIAKHGQFYTHRDGQGVAVVKIFPHSTLAQKLSEQLLRFEREFGLTPASRAGIEVAPRSEPGGKARFFHRDTG